MIKDAIKCCKIVKNISMLLKAASEHGGIWISSSGGTANIISKFISEQTGVTFKEAQNVLIWELGEDWNDELYHNNKYVDKPLWKIDKILKESIVDIEW